MIVTMKINLARKILNYIANSALLFGFCYVTIFAIFIADNYIAVDFGYAQD